MKNNKGADLLGGFMPFILAVVAMLVIAQIAFLGQILGFVAFIICIKMRLWRSSLVLAMFLVFPVFPMVSVVLLAVNLIVFLTGALK